MNTPEPKHKFDSDLLRFLARHLIVGIFLGETALAGLMLLDVGGLRTLIWNSSERGIALSMLMLFFALTFGSLAMGTGIASLVGKGGRDKDRE
jgi:hypothetical protein